MTKVIAAALLLIAGGAAVAQDLTGIQGYTVLTVATIPGTFNGCAPGRTVEIGEHGLVARCIGSGYQYAYRPSVAVLVNPVTADGGSRVVLCQLLVDDTLHAANCNALLQEYMRLLRAVAADGNDYAAELLARFEAIGIPW